MSSRRRRSSIQVLLNVYDLVEANYYGYPFGVGAFHSGVQIDDKEYSFGGHEYDFSGIFVVEPRGAVGAKFRETINMGETTFSASEIQSLVDSMAPNFSGNTYNLFQKNCNHFSDELCKKLVEKPLPAYVNRMAWYGSFFSCFIGSNLKDQTPTGNVTGASNSSFTAFSGSGNRLTNNSNVKVPTVTTLSASQFAAFSGSGNRLIDQRNNNTSETSTGADVPKNEKLAAAALSRFKT